MRKKLVQTRNWVIRKVIGFDSRLLSEAAEEFKSDALRLESIIKSSQDASEKNSRQTLDAIGKVANNTEKNLELLKSQRDNIPLLIHELSLLRSTKEYSAVFKNNQPLISVRIATYNKTDELLRLSIASVLKQTYQNFEIIVVNDGPNEKTRKAIEALNDRRIRYYELPYRSMYPEDDHKRWMVAGSPGMNLGASLALGEWIAPLDDDDEFSPNHLEVLLKLALKNKSEMVYGALEKMSDSTSESHRIWSFPPERGAFSFQGALYMQKLNFFMYDQQSWLVDEPGDWNLCRRMLLAGVRMHASADVVGILHNVPIKERAKEG